MGDIAGKVEPKGETLSVYSLMALTIVLAIFGLVIALVFEMYPAAIFPCLIQIPLATLIGFCQTAKGESIAAFTHFVIMYGTVLYGNEAGWGHSMPPCSPGI